MWLDDSEIPVDTVTNQRRAVQSETDACYHHATMKLVQYFSCRNFPHFNLDFNVLEKKVQILAQLESLESAFTFLLLFVALIKNFS